MALPPFMKKKSGPAATTSKGAVSFLSGGKDEAPMHEAAESPAMEMGEESPDVKAEVQKLIDAHGLEAVKGALEECGEAAGMGGDAYAAGTSDDDR